MLILTARTPYLYSLMLYHEVNARISYGAERVLIVDWDVYHGTGTQHIFEEDSTVLYFSIHRYENGAFFPGSKTGAPLSIGRGDGEGMNVNVGWNSAGMGDDDYLAAFQCVLIPIAKEFDPQLILVSAGFSAAHGDVGGCRVSPAGFAQMTRMLQNLCPRVVLVLEGGYKISVVPEHVAACTRALLGDDLELRKEAIPSDEARVCSSSSS